MQSVVYSIGFEPKDFCLTDLENIFKMFLGHQKCHGRRTVICREDVEVCDTWVLNKVLELTELEIAEEFGLFVILSGRSEVKELLYNGPLQDVVAMAGHHIPISPLGLAESREFILQQIQSEHTREASEIIKFEAITEMHNIGNGVPDTISRLCFKSMELATAKSAYPITPHLVNKAACLLGLAVDNGGLTVELKGLSADYEPPASDCIIVTLGDKAIGERQLDSDCVSVGRDAKNDLCIPSLAVSRHHVLIINSTKGVTVMDLGSTNGTYVNGRMSKSALLEHGDIVRLGDCQIEYVAAETKSPARPENQDIRYEEPARNNVAVLSQAN